MLLLRQFLIQLPGAYSFWPSKGRRGFLVQVQRRRFQPMGGEHLIQTTDLAIFVLLGVAETPREQ